MARKRNNSANAEQPQVEEPQVEQPQVEQPQVEQPASAMLMLRRNWPSSSFRRTVCGEQLEFTREAPVELSDVQVESLGKDIGNALIFVTLNEKGLAVPDWDETEAAVEYFAKKAEEARQAKIKAEEARQAKIKAEEARQAKIAEAEASKK